MDDPRIAENVASTATEARRRQREIRSTSDMSDLAISNLMFEDGVFYSQPDRFSFEDRDPQPARRAPRRCGEESTDRKGLDLGRGNYSRETSKRRVQQLRGAAFQWLGLASIAPDVTGPRLARRHIASFFVL